MNATPAPVSWDIFCAVIDNYGDIGVAWRLARQLSGEYGFKVRLWVDDLVSFQKLCPDVRPTISIQNVLGVEIHAWGKNFPETVTPARVVVEAFGCHLPDKYKEAMAAAAPLPVWINLEYLSAEAWVETCHALPSPHPPLTKYFYFPGYTEKTGGLLRERGLDEHRRLFCNSPEQQTVFWNTLGETSVPKKRLTVFLFAYENAALPDLLELWATGETPIRCIIPPTCSGIDKYLGESPRPGEIVQRGKLEILQLPTFIPQIEFDKLLWLSDINFVRGEDSFVRAQWAARPLIWHIYPQEKKAHHAKLDAFLERYCEKLTAEASKAVYSIHHDWNAGRISPKTWSDWITVLPELQQHAENWGHHMRKQDDLCFSLVNFCLSRL